MTGPNVLLIVLDAARADAFEPYGAAAGSTPEISDLARRGTAVANAYAAASWTVPSHASMFTGLLPRATGLAQAPGGSPHGCRPRMEALKGRLLPDVLRRNGYSTRGISANLWLSAESGFATGFESFAAVRGRRQPGMGRDRARDRARWALSALRAHEDDGADEAERILSGWLREKRTRPFFWFVNLIDCHSPYLPPLPFNPLGPLDRIRAANEANRHLTLDAIWRVCAGGWDIPDDVLRRMQDLYGGSIKLLDSWVGRMVSALDEAGALDDTTVIVTADHGENLGEGGLIGHTYSLDNRLIHVPWIAAGPGISPTDGVKSLIDLPGYVADAIGLDDHPWASDEDGKVPRKVAVAQFDPPAEPDDPRVHEAVARWGLGSEAIGRITTRLTCATDGRWKLLRRGKIEELYDLSQDPLELEPLAPESQTDAIIDPLRQGLGPEEPPAVSSGPTTELSEGELGDLEDRMRMLGYM